MTTALAFDPTPAQTAWNQRFEQALAACSTRIDRLDVIMRDFWFPDVVEGYVRALHSPARLLDPVGTSFFHDELVADVDHHFDVFQRLVDLKAPEAALALWPHVVRSFVGTYDTPLARLTYKTPLADDVRRRFRAIDAALTA